MGTRSTLSIIFTFALLGVGLVLGITFTILFAFEQYDSEHMVPDVCNVTASGVNTYHHTCSREHCTGTGKSRHCHTEYYTCYAAYWWIQFEIPSNNTHHPGPITIDTTIEGHRYASIYSARSDQLTYKVGFQYSFWYDTTNPYHARWSKPNPVPYMATMIVGWSLIGLAMFPLAFWICGCEDTCVSNYYYRVN